MSDIVSLVSVVPDRKVLEGTKMKVGEIINLPLVFTGCEFADSKFKDETGKSQARVTLQFELNGVKHVIFSSSGVLIEQLKAFIAAMPNEKKFSATIRKIDNFEKFC